MIETREEVLQKYQLVVGLEVHAQLQTSTKAYSGAINSFGNLPNSNTCPLSLGHPGTLPRLNEKVITFAMKLGIALNCHISNEMFFARKNYFYADLPKGYQITQDKTPICIGGNISIKDDAGADKSIGITRIHIEEDAGKSIHDQDPYNTLIDLNRAGVPLLEIVSEPDMRSGEEAYNYLGEIRRLVRYLDICDGNMEEGSLRCDANVSVMLKDADSFGNRCEVKNMNSLRNVQRAIEYEMRRQVYMLESGNVISQETRSFDAVNGTTFPLRDKEDAQDYRYFPEPDLQPLSISLAEIEKVKKAMPALPRELFVKYHQDFGLSEYDASVLIETKSIAIYYNSVLEHTNQYKSAANWVMGEIKSYLNQNAVDIEKFPLPPVRIAEIIELVDSDALSHSIASQQLFPLMLKDPESSAQLIATKNDLIQKSDDKWLKDLAVKALSSYPEKVEAYKKGNKGLLGLFMGEMMKLSDRKANPKKSSEILKNMLDT